MLLTALQPPPPTPTTLIRADVDSCSSSSKRNIQTSFLNAGVRGRGPVKRKIFCFSPAPDPWPLFLKELLHPTLHLILNTLEQLSLSGPSMIFFLLILKCIEDESRPRGIHGAANDVDEPSHPGGNAASNRKTEHPLGHLDHPI